jgi:hypothetical protein
MLGARKKAHGVPWAKPLQGGGEKTPSLYAGILAIPATITIAYGCMPNRYMALHCAKKNRLRRQAGFCGG